jgi:Fe-S cluster biogenesis protein NfuA
MSLTLLEKKVATVIEVIRPAIQADDGDIFLRGVDPETGVVSVELTGACVACPVSTVTLKDGIERILTARVEGVTSVQHVGAELAGANVEVGTAVIIGGAKVSPLAP